MIDVNSIIQFINLIRSLVAESQNNGELDTVADLMSQAWLNTLESLYMRLNPGLIRTTISRVKMIWYIFRDPSGVTRSKSIQTIGVFHKYFSQLNIDEKIFPSLTEQCYKLKDTKKSPFQYITDKELINLFNSNTMEEHIITFIKKNLNNKTELLSFLQKYNQIFFDAFKAHFYAIVDYEKINTIMNQIQCQQLEQQNQQLEINTVMNQRQCQQLEQQNQQLEQQSQQLKEMNQKIEKLNKKQKNLVEKDEKFYEISITQQETTSTKRKKEKKVAYCYSQYGKYILMAGSYVIVNPTDKCTDDIIKLREQYADYIADDGLVLKNVHFPSKSTEDSTKKSIVNFVNYAKINKLPKQIRKKYKKFFKNADNEWEFDIYNKHSKRNS